MATTSFSVYVNDPDNFADATAAANEIRPSGAPNGPEQIAHLGNHLKRLSRSGSSVVRVQMGTAALVRAKGTVTLSAVDNGDTCKIGNNTFTAAASANAANKEWASNNGDNAASATSLAAVINANTTSSKLFSATAVSNTVIVTCLVPGLIGNSVQFVGNDADVSCDGSGTLGGTTAGAGGDDVSGVIWAGPSGGTSF